MRHTQFSKLLLIQESLLIWVLTLAFIMLAFCCVWRGYTGTLPWLAVALTGAWTAYGVSQAMYYKKSERENTKGGIVFEKTMSALKNDPDRDI